MTTRVSGDGEVTRYGTVDEFAEVFYDVSANVLIFQAPASGTSNTQEDRISIAAGGALVFNEGALDRDLRVEGAGEVNLFVLDAGTDTAAIGGAVTAGVQLTIESDTDETTTEILRLVSTRATRGATDTLYIGFYSPDSAGNQEEVGRISFDFVDETDATEDSVVRLHAQNASTLTEVLELGFTSAGAFHLAFGGVAGLDIPSWTTTNLTTDRSINADGNVAEVGDGLCQLIEDLRSIGILA